jgi:hypothetical protein
MLAELSLIGHTHTHIHYHTHQDHNRTASGVHVLCFNFFHAQHWAPGWSVLYGPKWAPYKSTVPGDFPVYVCVCELSVCWCHWDSARHLPCKLLGVSQKLFAVIKPTGDPVQKDCITLVLSQGLTAIGFH